MGLIKDYGTNSVTGGTKLLGSQESISGSAESTSNFTVDAMDSYLSSVRIASAPATSSDAGTAGEYAIDSAYIYCCVATNSWKRAALSSF